MVRKVIENKYIEMIHASFDGELSSSAQAELDAYLAGSEEARAYRASLEKLDDLLQEVGVPEAPARLKEDILALINPTNGRFTEGKKQQAAKPRWSIPAFAMAASLVLAVSLVFVAKPLKINEIDNVSGTMVGQPQSKDPVSHHIEAEDLAADLGIEWSGGTLVLNIGLESAYRTTTTLEFPEERFAIEPLSGLARIPGGASLEHSGSADIVLRFQASEAVSTEQHSIRVIFSRDGKTVSKAALAVPPRG